jgi:hypothetical protein
MPGTFVIPACSACFNWKINRRGCADPHLAVERFFAGRSGGGVFEMREKTDEIRNKRGKGSHGMLPPNFAQAGDGLLVPRRTVLHFVFRDVGELKGANCKSKGPENRVIEGSG